MPVLIAMRLNPCIGPVERGRRLIFCPISALQAALNTLRYTTYHMSECIIESRNKSMARWYEATKAKYMGQGREYKAKDFDKMLWPYDVSRTDSFERKTTTTTMAFLAVIAKN